MSTFICFGSPITRRPGSLQSWTQMDAAGSTAPCLLPSFSSTWRVTLANVPKVDGCQAVPCTRHGSAQGHSVSEGRDRTCERVRGSLHIAPAQVAEMKWLLPRVPIHESSWMAIKHSDGWKHVSDLQTAAWRLSHVHNLPPESCRWTNSGLFSLCPCLQQKRFDSGMFGACWFLFLLLITFCIAALIKLLTERDVLISIRWKG